MHDHSSTATQHLRNYERVIKDFVLDERGYCLVFSDDEILTASLRSTFSSHLKLKDCVRFAIREEELLKEARRIVDIKGKPLFFIERIVSGRTNNQLIKFLKTSYPESQTLLMTTEADRNLLVFLHEIGADNFIVKPVSMNTLIEKIALTIRPQRQLPKLVSQGKELICNGEYQKALDVADKILEIKPNSSAALMLQGDAHLHLGRDDQALEAYLQAAHHANMYLEPLKKIVEYFRKKHDVQGQLAYLEKLERLSPMNMDRKIEIGELYLQQGEMEKADVYFKQALRISSKQARDMLDHVTLNLAEACLKKDAAMAERYFREFLDGKNTLTQADVHVLNRLGIALRKQGLWEEAVAEYKRALPVAKEAEIILYNIGMALMEGGRFEDACDMFENAMQINKAVLLSSDTTAFNIGVAMQKVQRRATAREMYGRVKELNPDFPGIDKRISDVS